MSDYDAKHVAMMVAVAGAALGLAYNLSIMATEIMYARLSWRSALNVTIYAVLFYLCTKYELLRVIYGWLLIIETALVGIAVAQAKKH